MDNLIESGIKSAPEEKPTNVKTKKTGTIKKGSVEVTTKIIKTPTTPKTTRITRSTAKKINPANKIVPKADVRSKSAVSKPSKV